VKANQQTHHRQIRSQFHRKRRILFEATDQRGLDRHQLDRGDGRWQHPRWQAVSGHSPVPHQPAHDPKTLLQLVRNRWRIEGWHWIRDIHLQEDAHCYWGNGAGRLASLRSAALNLLRLVGIQSISAGMQAVMHIITALLAVAMSQPVQKRS
jgi:hypothetical protein